MEWRGGGGHRLLGGERRRARLLLLLAPLPSSLPGASLPRPQPTSRRPAPTPALPARRRWTPCAASTPPSRCSGPAARWPRGGACITGCCRGRRRRRGWWSRHRCAQGGTQAAGHAASVCQLGKLESSCWPGLAACRSLHAAASQHRLRHLCPRPPRAEEEGGRAVAQQAGSQEAGGGRLVGQAQAGDGRCAPGSRGWAAPPCCCRAQLPPQYASVYQPDTEPLRRKRSRSYFLPMPLAHPAPRRVQQ